MALLIVLALASAFVYLRVDDSLTESLETSLGSRADDLVALVQSSRSVPQLGSPQLGDPEDSFSQVLSPDGAVVSSTLPGAGAALTPAQTMEAIGGPLRLELPGLEGVDGGALALAAPARSAGGRMYVAVAGTSTQEREEALEGVLGALAVGGPLAVLLATGAGYLLAGRALAPVEAMRARAGAIDAGSGGERLPLPPAHDELRRLGETLNAMLARLEEAIASQRELVADAGHELRTPLAILRTELELASSGERSRDELAAAIRAAIEEVDRLSRLADDLLLIARREEGALPLRLELVPLESLLERVVARFRAGAADAGRELGIDCQPGLEARLDPLRIEQAVANLIDNALRHGDGAVTVSATALDGELSIGVTDSGPGFPAGFEERAFDRFSRPEQGRTGPGSGLGLAIVRAVAEAHGGRAELTSEPGSVSVAVVLPPARPAAG